MSRRENTWSVHRWYADDRSLKLYRVYGPNGNTRLFTSWRNALDWATLQASIDIWRDSDF